MKGGRQVVKKRRGERVLGSERDNKVKLLNFVPLNLYRLCLNTYFTKKMMSAM